METPNMSSDEIEYDFAFMKTMYYWRSVREANGRSGRPKASVVVLQQQPKQLEKPLKEAV